MIRALVHWDDADGGLASLELSPAPTQEAMAPTVTAALRQARGRRNLRFQVYDDQTWHVLLRGRAK